MSEKKINRAFVFNEDKSDLPVIKYTTGQYETTSRIFYWVPSEKAIIADTGMVYLDAEEPKDLAGKEEGVISGDKAMVFRFLIKSTSMSQFCMDWLKENTQLFIRNTNMPKSNKTKVKAVDLPKKAGVLLRAKQLVAYFNDQPADADANVRQIAEYLSGLHDESDPAPIIQCTSRSKTSVKKA